MVRNRMIHRTQTWVFTMPLKDSYLYKRKVENESVQNKKEKYMIFGRVCLERIRPLNIAL